LWVLWWFNVLANRIRDPVELMGVTIFVMVAAMLVANLILSRKGDIE